MSAPGGGESLTRLLEVIAQLREHCPWMGALTHESLTEYLVEEAYELLEALEGPAGTEEIRSELGDVLLQVVLHARLQEEVGSFSMSDVIDGLTAKMVRRNPHVFTPEGELRPDVPATVEEIETAWHRLKQQEKPADSTPFAGIPAHLPALALAAKSVSRARRSGARAAEAAAGTAAGTASAAVTSEEELGDVLLGLVGTAVDAGLDPERALRVAVRRYREAHSPGPAAPDLGSDRYRHGP